MLAALAMMGGIHGAPDGILLTAEDPPPVPKFMPSYRRPKGRMAQNQRQRRKQRRRAWAAGYRHAFC